MNHHQRPCAGRGTFALGSALLSAILLLSGCGTSADGVEADTADSGSGSDDTFYSSKTPYHPFEDADEYSQAPEGYSPVFIEHVARHGSRLLSSKKYDDLSLQLWNKARTEGELTSLGEGFGPEVEALTAANEKLGYGNLSALGAQEHQGIASRMASRQEDLFAEAADASEHVRIVTSGQDRAIASGENFAGALASAEPDLILDDPETDEDLLYFHKTNSAYQDYLENDTQVASALDTIAASPEVDDAARGILEQIFTPAFVDRIAAGEFDFTDHGKGKKHLNDVASASDSIFNLYLIAPGMADEGDWDFDKYVPSEDAQVLSFYADAQNFYKKGPGFDGDDITYRMADVLLDDFFDQIQNRIEGRSDLVGDFRFTHAEVIMPFATLLGLPGSTEQVSRAEPYAYDSNAWRGETVTPMAANVQWEVYEDSEENYAVRMLYNEKETEFKDGCEPLSEGSYFYEFTELKRCYGRS